MIAEAEPVGTETVSLADAAGRVLAEPILADRDLPPFSRSERDGWAVRSADLSDGKGTLIWDGRTFLAGDEPEGELRPGRCVRIMTGAPLPEGADAVVMLEDGRERGAEVDLGDAEIRPLHNVHRRGIDASRGDALLSPGVSLTPGRVAVAASVGAARVVVRRRVRVSMISTGDEIVPSDETPGATRLRDGNGPVARAVLGVLPWADLLPLGIVGDDPDAVAGAVREALKEADAVVLSGGVSMGDRDTVPGVLRSCGVREILHKVAIRPGKPFWFGVSGERILVFGLPGNPVSFHVTLHEFVLTGLRRLAGFSDVRPRCLHLPVSRQVDKELVLRQFIPARLTGENGRTVVEPLVHHGSGDFVGASEADGVLVLPEGPRRVVPGDLVAFHGWRFP